MFDISSLEWKGKRQIVAPHPQPRAGRTKFNRDLFHVRREARHTARGMLKGGLFPCSRTSTKS